MASGGIHEPPRHDVMACELGSVLFVGCGGRWSGGPHSGASAASASGADIIDSDYDYKLDYDYRYGNYYHSDHHSHDDRMVLFGSFYEQRLPAVTMY